MRSIVFSSRTTKEIIRDPLTLFFGLLFPIFLLVLLTLMNQNIPGDIFDINELTPGIAVFGLSFMALFAGQIIVKDRASELLTRLFTTPMKSSDFIIGYTLPLIPMSILQTIFCFIAALFLGMEIKWTILPTILSTFPIGIVFISTGLLLGSILSEKAVGGILGALMTNVTALFSGVWFSVDLVGGSLEKIAHVLPFYHAVEMSRATLRGEYAGVFPHIWWVLGYAIILSGLVIFVFKKKMKA